MNGFRITHGWISSTSYSADFSFTVHPDGDLKVVEKVSGNFVAIFARGKWKTVKVFK